MITKFNLFEGIEQGNIIDDYISYIDRTDVKIINSTGNLRDFRTRFLDRIISKSQPY